MNILKLLILVPFMWFLCVIIGGSHWPLVMVVAFVLGWFWFKAEQDRLKKKAVLEQQVVITRQNMIQAQADAERAQRNADIEAAVQQGVEKAQMPKRLKGQWN
jgi:hypothetical protein